jgi:DNA-binding transcriptional LysR family regulator
MVYVIITMADVRETNLNLLLVFDALVATGSVTRAAEQVGLTQSGASNALAQLRLHFGDPLFERHGRGVRPTPRALEIAPDVRSGIEAFRRALAPREFSPSDLARTFHLAMPDSVQLVVVPPLLRGLAKEAPNVAVRVRAWTEQRVPEELASGEMDFFAGFARSIPGEHEVAVLYDDTFVCMIRKRHPALKTGKLSLEAWLSCGHVIVTRDAAGATDVDRTLADRGLQRRISVRVENALLAPALVASSDLVALVDRTWASRVAHEGVRLVEPPIAFGRGRVRLVWHRRLAHDPGGRWLRDRLLSGVAQMLAS